MVRLKSLKTFPFKSMLVILCVFMMMAVVLFAERSGIQYTEKNRKVAYLDREEVVTEQTAVKSLPKTCLVLRNSADEASEQAWTQFQQIFKDMKVGTDVVDLKSDSVIPDYDEYETVVVLLSDISPLKEKLLELCDWVSEGGNALFAMTLQKTAYTSIIEQKLGIISSGYENTVVDSIYFEPDFMLGGGQAYEITDPYDSAWSVQLSEQAKVHAQVEDENGQPAPVYSVASGLDYPSSGPEHAFLHDLGRVKYDVIGDDDTIDAFFKLSRMEGIIPAIESSHAVAYALKLAEKMGKGSILINLSGRGDKDMDYVIEKYGIR